MRGNERENSGMEVRSCDRASDHIILWKLALVLRGGRVNDTPAS